MRECEVKRLRLELQMAHIGSILQKRRENARKMEEAYDHDADIPDVLLDDSGGHNRSQRSYHKSKSHQKIRSNPSSQTKLKPSGGLDYSSPGGQNQPFHISELDSTEEHKSSPLLHGDSVVRRLESDSPPKRKMTKDEEIRDKTKMIMSLAGNLLTSEYAKCSSLVVDDDSSHEGDAGQDEKGIEGKIDDIGVTIDDQTPEETGRLSPLEKVIRETSGQLGLSINTLKSKSDKINEKGNDRSQSPPKSPTNLRGRFGALSSGFVPRPVLEKRASTVSVEETTTGVEDDENVNASGNSNDVSSPPLHTTDSDVVADEDMVDKSTSKQPTDRPGSPKRKAYQVEYDHNGRKLFRAKSGELIPSRSLRKSVSLSNKKSFTGRYSFDTTTPRPRKGGAVSKEPPVLTGDEMDLAKGSQSEKAKLMKSQSMGPTTQSSKSNLKSQPQPPIAELPSAESSVSNDSDAQKSSSLGLLMDHLQDVADSVVGEVDRPNRREVENSNKVSTSLSSNSPKHDDLKPQVLSRMSSIDDLDSSNKILWQEALISELLLIILNQTDVVPGKFGEASSDAPHRRVRSNSMDSHCTDAELLPPPPLSNSNSIKSPDQSPKDKQIKKYQELLTGVKSQDLIDLLYAQQKQLKIAQMENEVHKMELQATAKRQKMEELAATTATKDNVATEKASRKVSSPASKTSTVQAPISPVETSASSSGRIHHLQAHDTGSGNHDLENFLDEDPEIVDVDTDSSSVPEPPAFSSYTDLYLATSEEQKQKLAVSSGQDQDQVTVEENVHNSSRVEQHEITELPSKISNAEDKIMPKKSSHREHGTQRNGTLPSGGSSSHPPSFESDPAVVFDPDENIFTSPFSEERLALFLANATSIEVQEKHQQLSTERTELPIPPPKEFNVYSRRMSELDSLNLQLQKWNDKLQALQKSETPAHQPSEKNMAANARLDMTVITARYLPEMKKVSSLLQSSLYAEMTVESINPHGFDDTLNMWRATGGQSRDDDSDTTISDISDGDSIEEEDPSADPESVLSLV